MKLKAKEKDVIEKTEATEQDEIKETKVNEKDKIEKTSAKAQDKIKETKVNEKDKIEKIEAKANWEKVMPSHSAPPSTMHCHSPLSALVESPHWVCAPCTCVLSYAAGEEGRV